MIGETDGPPAEDPLVQLNAAIDRATRLVAELERKAADLKQKPPRLPAQDLETGMLAMEGAVGSARRLLASLLSAREVAGNGDAERDE